MFGGLTLLVHGTMAVGVSGHGGLMVRCDPADTDDLVDPPLLQPFEMGTRTMRGWLRVTREAISTADDLSRWVDHGLSYARPLDPK